MCARSLDKRRGTAIPCWEPRLAQARRRCKQQSQGEGGEQNRHGHTPLASSSSISVSCSAAIEYRAVTLYLFVFPCELSPKRRLAWRLEALLLLLVAALAERMLSAGLGRPDEPGLAMPAVVSVVVLLASRWVRCSVAAMPALIGAWMRRGRTCEAARWCRCCG